MNILVLLKMVPDIVEELVVAPEGKTLDADYVRTILNERDDHALEEGLLLKERHGGTLTVVALDAPEIDDVLFTALAKGADRAVKVTGVEMGTSTRTAAHVLADVLSTTAGLMPADIILTGVQALDDLDTQVPPLLSHLLNLPYMGIVSQVVVDSSANVATVSKEYPGGVRAEFELPLPAILGIQSAEKTPRYIMVSKVTAAMKTRTIEQVPAPEVQVTPLVEILRMTKPEAAGHAEMLEGSPDEVAQKVYELLAERSIL
jgi:electron transfer flavoprotein beta subunit